MFVLYLAALGICLYATDIEKMEVKTINHIIPQSMSALVGFSLHPNLAHPEPLKEYATYFKIVMKFVPESPADQALLGYCYYYLGDLPKAQKFFKKAVDGLHRQPIGVKDFFWFHYNLGVSYLRQKDYAKAKDSLQKALLSPPQMALYFMQVSRAYKVLTPVAAKLGYDLEVGLLQGYRSAQQLLMITEYGLEPPPEHVFHARIF